MRARSLVSLVSLVSLAFVTILVAACSGTTADAGLDCDMQVDGAQFFRGAMPAEASGPKVASVALITQAVRAGQIGKSATGALEPPSTAAALMLDGDRGYWLLPAGVPDVQSPTFPSFKASLSFARTLAAGNRDLVVRAIDGAGHFGPASPQTLTIAADGPPAGKLVFSLTWDSESDLDLHVVDPTGAEVYKGNINSWAAPPPGQPTDPNAWKTGGILDVDSNASCVIDGLRREDVVYATAAPAGHYVVRVDTFSLCSEVSAHWTVVAIADGVVLGKAQGASFETDTEMPHDRGAGVLALEIDR